MVPASAVLGLVALAVIGTCGAAPPALASPGTVVLWSCHGPTGQPLGNGGLTTLTHGDGAISTYGTGCQAQSTDPASGGLTAELTGGPADGSLASFTLTAPSTTTIAATSLARTTTDLAGPVPTAGPEDYTLDAGATTLEQTSLLGGNAPLTGVFTSTSPLAAPDVSIAVACGPTTAGQPCTTAAAGGPVGVDFAYLAATVTDAAPPTATLSGLRQPASATETLTIQAADPGLGLQSASATLDGQPVATADLAGPGCDVLPPSGDTINIAAASTCAPNAAAPLPIDTTAFADGQHQLVVTVADLAGNTTTAYAGPFTIRNTIPANVTAVVAGVGAGPPAASTGPGGSKPPAGSSGGNPPTNPCPGAALRARLVTKPLRLLDDTPLFPHERLVFRGTLSCLSGSRRVHPPRGTRLAVTNRLPTGRILVKTGVAVHANGQFTWISSRNYGSRTYRFTLAPPTGRIVRVAIRVKVLTRPTSRRSSGPSGR